MINHIVLYTQYKLAIIFNRSVSDVRRQNGRRRIDKHNREYVCEGEEEEKEKLS